MDWTHQMDINNNEVSRSSLLRRSEGHHHHELPPLWVKLIGSNKPVSSGKSSSASCEVVGASPAPKLLWTLGGTALNNSSQITSEDRNTTTSRIIFIANANDHGKLLNCHIDTEGKKPLQDSWKLNVLHAPVIRLTLGAPLRSQTVKKGSDVYLECHVNANPLKYIVEWKHNGHKIVTNNTDGIISTNNSLVIQHISKENAGSYVCQAENSQGIGYSNELSLNVQCE
ncbi:sialic acid-binding Ig-like lectin 5 [Ctenocephalides felis]|uniref:sialic acid-binding Ig-like lectin 5 n=1 Tax=Ctenocephalides felis TaxID=7515 RepID=UPI000E6E17E4|nr:sialic acid-binding Ig-like lectin 5 [Ctenocephalides felis]